MDETLKNLVITQIQANRAKITMLQLNIETLQNNMNSTNGDITTMQTQIDSLNAVLVQNGLPTV